MNTRRTLHGTKISSTLTFVTLIAVVLAISITLTSLNLATIVHGKEIVAKKNEWTLIGENDTVDAGMHIRIDMTTGEKWVKQITDDDDDDNNDPSSTPSSLSPSTTSQAVAVTNSDDESSSNREEVELTMKGDQNTILPKIIYRNQNNHDDDMPTTTTSLPSKNDTPQQKYDFDMMYRTLSKLPMDEQIRMQLPQVYIPAVYSNTTTTSTRREEEEHYIQRKEFERQLQYIWEQRQNELQQLDIADIPQVLQQYVNDLHHYVEIVIASNEQNNINIENTTHQEQQLHVLSVLKELEYQLQDIDAARDFHTLQGWSTLVQLLYSINTAPTSLNVLEEYTVTIEQQRQHEIQMYIAWVIGTAVKHIHEFSMYAIEPILIRNSTNVSTTTTTTAIDVIIQQLLQSYHEYNKLIENSTLGEDRAQQQITGLQNVLQKKLLRYIYSLGSLLRGNYHSQYHILVPSKIEYSSSDIGQQQKDAIQNIVQQLVIPSLLQIIDQQQQDHPISNQEQHIMFFDKVVQRLLNIVVDCLVDLKDTNDIYDLRKANEDQNKRIRQIYEQWQNRLCNSGYKSTTAINEDDENGLLLNGSTTLAFHLHSILSPLLAASINDDNDKYEMTNIRSTLHSIFSHCPNYNISDNIFSIKIDSTIEE